MTDGLVVRLRQRRPVDLDLELACASGRVLGVVGPSGAGKTTLLRFIAGLGRADEGSIRVAGETWFDSVSGVWRPPHRRAVGLVFQEHALFPHLTALDNVALALKRLPARARREEAARLLARVHLAGLEQRRPSALSGGQRQRVAIARALARDPAVLLLDEPFSAVDRRTRASLHRQLAELRQSLDIPVVLVSHDIEEVVRLADEVAVLDRGCIVRHARADELLADADMRRLLLGDDG
ncbi:ATP-binding cassette domain-containing protein [Phenylobacterium kunshanense]|uniref:ABC transporter ATP-binding protein n=1 Tax=Phenylobacterium kunshanense TaxID=1445034 RepID=A0A328BKL9_9CAUL|nr:ATP-binding cassette domain-containing protein [Phenylobacterium kunshanense]RAK66484.1 ABC transporter ATP-binding protein [Phenylobacterium kunshanense]